MNHMKKNVVGILVVLSSWRSLLFCAVPLVRFFQLSPVRLPFARRHGELVEDAAKQNGKTAELRTRSRAGAATEARTIPALNVVQALELRSGRGFAAFYRERISAYRLTLRRPAALWEEQGSPSSSSYPGSDHARGGVDVDDGGSVVDSVYLLGNEDDSRAARYGAEDIANSRARDKSDSRASVLPVFVYWAQGFESAPPLVRACLAKMRRVNTETQWQVVALNRTNIGEWLSTSELSLVEGAETNWLSNAWFSRLANTHNAQGGVRDWAFASDLLRLFLLRRWGGIWIDANSVITENFDWVLREKLLRGGGARGNRFFAFNFNENYHLPG